MRKYQQLVLVLISVVSLTILLIYRSENSRLKDVLQVVNFFSAKKFGRDAKVLSNLENNTIASNSVHDFSAPLPVWQRLATDFYVYSSYWQKNDLVVGGEAISVVVGIEDSIISFKCGVKYKEGKIIIGKFGFIRVDIDTLKLDEINISENFIVYKFLCKITRDFGTPESLIFTNIKSKSNREVMLTHVKYKVDKPKQLMNVCVLMSAYNSTGKHEILTETNLLQFFFHHHAVGVKEFLIYDADYLPSNVRQILSKTGLHLHLFPYNFPFNYKTSKTRTIIEIDCLMRNTNAADFVMLLEPNEFFYPSSNIQFKGSYIRNLRNNDQELNVFNVPSFSVCIDHRNKLLVDNILYDPGTTAGHLFYIWKPHISEELSRSLLLSASNAFIHSYVNCISNKDLLYDWRSSFREDFMQYIETVRTEISFML